MQEKLPILALLPWRVVLIQYWYSCTDSVQQLMSVARGITREHVSTNTCFSHWKRVFWNKGSDTGLSGLKSLRTFVVKQLITFSAILCLFYTILCPVEVFLLLFNPVLSPFVVFYPFLRLFVAKSDIRTFLGVKLSKKLSKSDKSAFF